MSIYYIPLLREQPENDDIKHKDCHAEGKPLSHLFRIYLAGAPDLSEHFTVDQIQSHSFGKLKIGKDINYSQ